MKALYLVSIALAVGMALPANAAKSVSNQLSASQTAILKDIAEDGMFEVRLGQLAEKNSSNPAVKEFGKRMVKDHSQANEELMSAAKQHTTSLCLVPLTVNKLQRRSLAKLSGKDFDRSYINNMVKDHQKAVEVVEKVATGGSEPFKTWASQTLPTIKEHLQAAESLKSKLM